MHKESHNILNYAIHTKMSMVEEWWQTKPRTVNLTTLAFPILETLLFHFYAVDYLDFCFEHFITLCSKLYQRTMGVEVEFVYNILSFVRKCTMLATLYDTYPMFHTVYYSIYKV